MQSVYNISEAEAASQFFNFIQKVKDKISREKISTEISGNMLNYVLKNTLNLAEKTASEFVKTKILKSSKVLQANAKWVFPILITIASYLMTGNKAKAEETASQLPTHTMAELQGHLGFNSGTKVSLRSVLKYIYRDMQPGEFDKMIDTKYKSGDPKWENVDLDKQFTVYYDYKTWNLLRDKMKKDGDDPAEHLDPVRAFALPNTPLDKYVFLNPNKIMDSSTEFVVRIMAHEILHLAGVGGLDKKSPILTSREFMGADAVDTLVGTDDPDDLKYTNYAGTMRELHPRLADLVRVWYDHTGKTVNTKEEAKEVLTWLLKTKSWKSEDFPSNVEKEMFQDLYLGFHKILKVFKKSGGDVDKLIDILSDRMKDVAVDTTAQKDVSNIAESMYKKMALVLNY